MRESIPELEVIEKGRNKPPELLPLEQIPMPNGKPVPCFFGRRFLSFADLIEIGFVNNAMSLRRLIAEGRFPPPLALGRKLRLWDALELQDLVDRLKAERPDSRVSQDPAKDGPLEVSDAAGEGGVGRAL